MKIFLLSVVSFGQLVDLKKDNYWIDLGVGVASTVGGSEKLALNVSANLNKNNWLFKARVLKLTEFDVFNHSFSEKVIHIGGFVGRKYTKNSLQMTYFIGLGRAYLVERGAFIRKGGSGFSVFSLSVYEKKRMEYLSVPVEIEFALKTTKNWHVCLGAFADLNTTKISYGSLFKVRIGKLW